MLNEIARRKPDLLLHLGDYQHDIRRASDILPDVPILSVPGNCDFSGGAPVLIHNCGEVALFITHGHLHRVKQNLGSLKTAARAVGARVALFGHTHTPHNEDDGRLLLFNPGSIAFPRNGRPTFGLIEIDGARIDALVMSV